MKEIIAYEMALKGPAEPSGIHCVPFEEKYWNEYMAKYNESFAEMRRSLEVEPVNFYSSYDQMEDKAENTYLLLKDGEIAGAVSCYGNEVDDLFVAAPFRGQRLGRKLLLWGVGRIREKGFDEVILHVAEWNRGAVKMYSDAGFVIKNREKVR